MYSVVRNNNGKNDMNTFSTSKVMKELVSNNITVKLSLNISATDWIGLPILCVKKQETSHAVEVVVFFTQTILSSLHRFQMLF